MGDAIFAEERESLLEIRNLRNREFKADGETGGIGLDTEAASRTIQHSSPHSLSQREAEHQPTSGFGSIGTLTELESDKISISRTEHNELVAKFGALSRQYSKLADAHNALITKYKKERGTIRAWSDYIKRHRQSGRHSRPATSTNPSDDELTRSTIPTGTPINDTRTSYSGALGLAPPETSLPPLPRPTVRSPSSSQNGCRAGHNPIPPTGVHTASRVVGDAGWVDDLAKSPDPRGETSVDYEYSPTNTLLKPSSRQQQFARAKTQHLNETHLGYDSAETTDGEVERRNAVFSPSTMNTRGGHHSPKVMPGERALSPRTPAVLSERCLKRRMTPYYGSTTKPIQIKSEHDSSSPIGLAGFRGHYEVPESLDLDEVGEKVDTPRKRKKYRDIPSESRHHTNSLLVGPNLGSPEQRSAETLREAKDDCPGSLGSRETLRHLSEPGGIQSTEEAPHKKDVVPLVINELNGTHAFQRDLASQSPEATPHTSVLQSSSTNLRLSHCARGLKPKKSRSRSEERLEKKIASVHYLAEDGESILGGIPGESIPVTAGTFGGDVDRNSGGLNSRHKRLVGLLDTRSPSKTVLSPGKHLNRNTKQGTRRKVLPCDERPRDEPGPRQPHITALERDPIQPPVKETKARTREEPKAGSGKLANPASKHKQRLEPPNLDTAHYSRRLRDRPLQSLTLGDFKINPNYIRGSDFAFTETVRDQDQRKCLPGCIRPTCCGGTFRKALELGGIPISGPSKTKLLWNSSQEQEDEEQALLEDFVGDDRHLLHELTPEARCELVIQARTKQFADKHGRHRQAFERRATPPGFWRADMPTSQELEQDREEAERREKEVVEERYKEARRGKGKWIFRDE
ncbi:hypothetical protein FGG08_003669 [Glutinoglossum americanum]|uniref:DNA endonuclease activator Ctp1 C-terminal domain-containing protein n=1 Tax=Glutinoglossum americanum TaxID=1670608 RepID=A0A9P8ICT8_9PEZI|nr:hypothetical protein FGG08_003669 [Glutinoglossum americanum]